MVNAMLRCAQFFYHSLNYAKIKDSNNSAENTKIMTTKNLFFEQKNSTLDKKSDRPLTFKGLIPSGNLSEEENKAYENASAVANSWNEAILQRAKESKNN